MSGRVVHCKREPFDVYIGRGRGSIWGNPFEVPSKDYDRVADPENILGRYEAYVRSKPELMASLPELRGKTLGCWCAPKRCHGDVLLKLIAELDGGKRPEPGQINVVVTGGRDYTDRDLVFSVLDRIHSLTPIHRLSHGGASGADELANEWALARKVDIGIYEAQWRAYGDAAGPIRNRLMLTQEHPDIVIAFPGDKGTWGCIKLARGMGIIVEHAARDPKGALAALTRDIRENGTPRSKPQMSLFCTKNGGEQ